MNLAMIDKNYKNCCKKYKCNQKLICEEKKKTLYLQTSSEQFTRIKVDSGIINDSSIKKCDFIIVTTNKDKIIMYVELKGRDIKMAYEQIISTYNYIKKQHNKMRYQNSYAIIIHSSSPKTLTKQQNIDNKLRNLGLRLIKGNSPLELKYNDGKIDKV